MILAFSCLPAPLGAITFIFSFVAEHGVIHPSLRLSDIASRLCSLFLYLSIRPSTLGLPRASATVPVRL
jgi:hypothetical protein